jgi:hypothetical protein
MFQHNNISVSYLLGYFDRRLRTISSHALSANNDVKSSANSEIVLRTRYWGFIKRKFLFVRILQHFHWRNGSNKSANVDRCTFKRRWNKFYGYFIVIAWRGIVTFSLYSLVYKVRRNCRNISNTAHITHTSVNTPVLLNNISKVHKSHPPPLLQTVYSITIKITT